VTHDQAGCTCRTQAWQVSTQVPGLLWLGLGLITRGQLQHHRRLLLQQLHAAQSIGFYGLGGMTLVWHEKVVIRKWPGQG
jgi:hypothetical protein